jgi:NAD(P)H-dependent FMN reductase
MTLTEQPLSIAVIVGSTRQGRFAPVVSDWFVKQARSRHDMDVDVVDLADLDLPAVYPQSFGPEVRDYLARIDRADGYVVVTPEYNHSFPAGLKQAIDLAKREWQAKPVAFVSYGGLSGGLRAVEHLRQVFAELHAVTMRDTVSLHNVRQQFDESGQPIDAAGTSAAAKTMLDELAWWAGALRTARTDRPYAA